MGALGDVRRWGRWAIGGWDAGREGFGGRACGDAGGAVEARPSGRREEKMARGNGRVTEMCGARR